MFFARTIICTFLVVSPGQTLAAVSYNIAGSGSENHYGMERHSSRGGSGGVDIAVTKRISIGYSHRRELSSRDGYKEVQDEAGATSLKAFHSDTSIISNAIQLSYTLTEGGAFTPYVYGGLGHNVATSHEKIGDERSDVQTPSLGPQAGLGVALHMSKNLAFRISYTLAMGSIVRDPEKPGDKEAATNTYAQVGLAFHP